MNTIKATKSKPKNDNNKFSIELTLPNIMQLNNIIYIYIRETRLTNIKDLSGVLKIKPKVIGLDELNIADNYFLIKGSLIQMDKNDNEELIPITFSLRLIFDLSKHLIEYAIENNDNDSIDFYKAYIIHSTTLISTIESCTN